MLLLPTGLTAPPSPGLRPRMKLKLGLDASLIRRWLRNSSRCRRKFGAIFAEMSTPKSIASPIPLPRVQASILFLRATYPVSCVLLLRDAQAYNFVCRHAGGSV